MTPCPACAGPGPFAKVEDWRDPVAGGAYSLHECPSCGVVFSEPRVAVGAQWYEKAAPLRAREAKAEPAKDWRFVTFLAEPLAPGRLLDVGCGDGAFLALAQTKGWKGLGFDYETRMIERGRGHGVEIVSADFETFCKGRAPGEFDAATLFDVLEHTPEPARLLALLRPLLKEGGRLAITLPNARRPIPFRREQHDYPPHHFTRWSPEAMRAFLEKNGFVVERQDAGHLRVDYLSDHLFFFGLMPFALGAAKAALFGRRKEGTVSELYAAAGGAAAAPEPGSLADPALRARLVDWLKLLAKPLTWPAAFVMTAYYRATRELSGDCLYTLARRA
ncbi:MAG: class I SAM-dependent methyltransferase [Elusimicrobiota bacterium]|nr:class I SAM-dependent methyltransferase [Elusimicrobiota bacterium]